MDPMDENRKRAAEAIGASFAYGGRQQGQTLAAAQENLAKLRALGAKDHHINQIYDLAISRLQPNTQTLQEAISILQRGHKVTELLALIKLTSKKHSRLDGNEWAFSAYGVAGALSPDAAFNYLKNSFRFAILHAIVNFDELWKSILAAFGAPSK